MTYIAIITHGADTIRTTITAPNARTAHAKAAGESPERATIRVYPRTTTPDGQPDAYGIMRGALAVAAKTAKNTVSYTGGNESQNAILSALVAANAKAGTAAAEYYGVEYVMQLVAGLPADASDMVSAATDGIMSAMRDGADVPEQYHAAFVACNRLVKSLRRSHEKEVSTEYVMENNGDFVAISAYIAAILHDGDVIAVYDDIGADARAARIRAALTGAAGLISERRRYILALVTRGYSYSQIAKKLKIKSKGTVMENIYKARAAYVNHIMETDPELLRGVDVAAILTQAEKRENRK